MDTSINNLMTLIERGLVITATNAVGYTIKSFRGPKLPLNTQRCDSLGPYTIVGYATIEEVQAYCNAVNMPFKRNLPGVEHYKVVMD